MWTRHLVAAIAVIAAGLAASIPRGASASYPPRPTLKAPASLINVADGIPNFGRTIVEMSVGDWSGDGQPDLALSFIAAYAPTTTTWSVKFLKNEMAAGRPQLFSEVSAPPGFDPIPTTTRVVLGDLNADGKADLVMIDDSASDVVRVQLTTPGGSLGPAISYSIPGMTVIQRIFSADMDHDGLEDVAVHGYDGPTAANFAAILRNTGGGSLSLVTPVWNLGGNELSLGDLNSDSRPDLVDLAINGVCRIHLSTGSLDFAPPYSVTSPDGIEALVLKADGDAMPDLAVLTSGSLHIHHGTAGGIIPSTYDTVPLERSQAKQMTAGDLDDDSTDDIVISHRDDCVGGCDPPLLSGTIEIVDMTIPTWPHTFLAPGRNPWRPHVADFDRDGRLDLALNLNEPQDGHNVAVMMGPLAAEKGLALLLSSFPHSAPLGRPTVGDFNRDGNPDIAAPVAATTTLHLGNGSGGFSPGVSTSAAGGDKLFSCDLNRDGKPDLLQAEPASQQFRLKSGNGDGTFGAPSTIFALSGLILPQRPLVDMNRDGKEDVIGFGYMAILAVHGDGAGGFSGGMAPDVGLYAPGMDAVSVDLDRDGDLDLAVATLGDGIRLFMSDGASLLASAGTLGPGLEYSTITAGDLNRDGKPDLVAQRYFGAAFDQATEGLDIFYTDGAGNVINQATLGAPERLGVMLEIWDVNRDGLPDIACSARDDLKSGFMPTTTRVHLQMSPGVFSPRLDYAQGYTPPNLFTTVADADGDLQRDVVGFNLDLAGPVLTALQGNSYVAGWGVSGQQDFATGAWPGGLATGDMNRDGALDLVTADYVTNTISVLLGDGSGSFGAPQSQGLTAAIKVALTDLNRDGRMDVVALSRDPGGPLAVMLGNGDGTLVAPVFYTFSVSIPRDLEIGDFNRDGIPDVAASGSGSPDINVYLGNAGGGLTLATTITDPVGFPEGFSIGDMNRDGREDILIMTSWFGPRIYSAAGNGDGSFEAPTLAWTGAIVGDVPCGMAVGDVNRDGKLDVVVSLIDNFAYPAVLLYGDGADGFSSEVAYPAGGLANHIALGYLDGDKWIDLVSNSRVEGLLSVRLGDGTGGFGARVNVGQATISEGVVIADLDRDGLNDIAFSNSEQGTASVLINNKSNITAVAVADAPRVAGQLTQNAPNPFNPRTTIRFTLPSEGRAKLVVFDVNGRRVATLVDRPLPAGEHRVAWAGRDDVGRAMASGIYFYRLEAGEFSAARRMTLLK